MARNAQDFILEYDFEEVNLGEENQMLDEELADKRVEIFRSTYDVDFDCVERFMQLTRLMEVLPGVVGQRYQKKNQKKQKLKDDNNEQEDMEMEGSDHEDKDNEEEEDDDNNTDQDSITED